MEYSAFTYPFSSLLPTAEVLEKAMGYVSEPAPEPVRTLTDEVLKEILDIGEARAEFRVFKNIELSEQDKSLTVGGIRFDIKSIIFSQMRRSEEIAFFLCTAGALIGERSRSFMKNNDLLKGYIYDVAGTEIVENAADLMQDTIKKQVEAGGKRITNRFSPGYCGWSVSEQHSLFRFFPGNHCGITLTDSALMSPVKSVSGIIGIGREVRYSPYQCKICDDRNCIYRNRKR